MHFFVNNLINEENGENDSIKGHTAISNYKWKRNQINCLASLLKLFKS